jgi:hypothetical protein
VEIVMEDVTMDNIGLSPGPVISTQEEARTVNDLTHAWKIVARCSHKTMLWSWCFERENMAAYSSFRNDGIIATVQRRDAGETVLLAKWAR